MTENNKRAYEKMTVEKVSLIPQEAVLGGCKTDTGGGIGKAQGGDSCALITAACSTEGVS